MATITRTASSRELVKPNLPTLALKSEFKGTSYISDIALAGDAAFVRHGSLIVEIDNARVFELTAGELGNAQSMKIQTAGRRITHDTEINFYLFTDSDDIEVTITVALSNELHAGQATQAFVPADIESINRQLATPVEAVSDPLSPISQFMADLAASVLLPDLTDARQAILSRGFSLESQQTYADLFDANGEPELAAQLRRLHETEPLPGTDDSSLFPFRTYRNESHAKLINLRGNKNMIVTLRASDYTPPQLLTPAQTGLGADWHSPNPNMKPRITYSADRQSASLSDATHTQVTGRYAFDTMIDDGSAQNISFERPQFLSYGVTFSPSGSNFGYATPTSGNSNYPYRNWQVVALRDNISVAYAVAQTDSIADGFGLPDIPVRVTSGRHRFTVTKRYFALQVTTTVTWSPRASSISQSPNFRDKDSAIVRVRPVLAGMRDDLLSGGSAQVSFEVRDSADNWLELIPAVALTEGQQKLSQFGQGAGPDAKLLPSGQDILRARLSVTGGIQTAASLISVA